MNSGAFQSVAFLVVAVMVIAFLGAFVLLYPNDPKSYMALGTLLTIAGGVGTALFHSSTQAFLGAQLAAARGITVAALTNGKATSGTSSTGSTTTSASPPTSPAPSSPPPVPTVEPGA